MRNPLKRLGQRGAPKLTMRERATLLKASAARVIRRRPAVQPTDQPSGETLLTKSVSDRNDDGFRSARHLSHERGEGAAEGTTRDCAGNAGSPRSERDMGRHETFDTALPLVEDLLSSTAIGPDPLEGGSCPPGFIPFPLNAPTGFAEIGTAIECVGTDLLRIARSELRRHRAEVDRVDWMTEDQRQSHGTVQHRVLHIDALTELAGFRKPDRDLPEAGSEAAQTAFRDACRKTDINSDAAVRGYPELRRDGYFWWETDTLQAALDAGAITVAEFARLYPLAAERERRIEAAAASANLHVLYALAHPKEASPTDDNDVAEDPAKSIIARHKAAFAVARPLLDQWSDTLVNTPAWDAARAAMKGPNEVESEAFDALLDIDATTLDGLLALAEYLPGAVKADGIDADMCAVPMKALETICRNLKWLARQGRILPHARQLPESQPAPDAPVDLAGACDWAVQHIDWMNAGVGRDDWTDEQSEVEWKKSDDVWTRALNEPALDLATLAAKARMLRQDWLNEHARAETDGDGRVRLALRVLNDAITLASSPASASGVELARAVRAYFETEPDPILDADLELWTLSSAIIETSSRFSVSGPIVEPSELVAAMQKEWLTFAALSSDDPDDAFDDCTRRRFDLFEAADRLPATRDNLLPKALSLAWLDFVEHERPGQPRSAYPIDGRLALDIHAIMTAGLPGDAAAESDPIVGAIDASRAAEAAMAAWQKRSSRRKPGSRPNFAEEERLEVIQRKARDAALATTPTTYAGRLALLDYIRFVHGLYGIKPGDGPCIDHAHVWKQTHDCLMAALVAPVGGGSFAVRPDFSSLTLKQLGAMHETMKCLWLHATAELQAPWCWSEDNYNPAGDILEAEGERYAGLLDVLRDEARSRVPADDEERAHILGIRLINALSGSRLVEDRELMADVAKAWGA